MVIVPEVAMEVCVVNVTVVVAVVA